MCKDSISQENLWIKWSNNCQNPRSHALSSSEMKTISLTTSTSAKNPTQHPWARASTTCSNNGKSSSKSTGVETRIMKMTVMAKRMIRSPYTFLSLISTYWLNALPSWLVRDLLGSAITVKMINLDDRLFWIQRSSSIMTKSTSLNKKRKNLNRSLR